MINRRGIPFPVQDDTRTEPEVNPIERVEGTQNLTQEKTFSYERALFPETANLQIDVVEPDQLVNPQPPTDPAIRYFQNMGIIAEKPIANKLVADQSDFSQRFKTYIHSKDYVSESIPNIHPRFKDPKRKTEYPLKDKQVVSRESLNFLDRFFNWINSVLGE